MVRFHRRFVAAWRCSDGLGCADRGAGDGVGLAGRREQAVSRRSGLSVSMVRGQVGSLDVWVLERVDAGGGADERPSL
jgi:hypothetical protein